MEIFPRKDVMDRTLEYVLERPMKKIKVTDIASALSISKGHVSTAIAGLRSEGIIKKDGVDLNNPYVRSLKIAINMNKIVNSGIIHAIKKAGATSAGLYGSWVNGTNTEESDIDIWIKTPDSTSALEIAKISSVMSDTLHAEPQILRLNSVKIKKLKNDSVEFYFTLLFNSIILFGDGLGQA